MNKIVVLSIGNEILLGKTVNTNAAFIGERLSLAGYEVVANLACADTKESITQMLNFAYNLAEVVVCTGGLGPTVDDITRGVVADFFGQKLQLDADLWAKIKLFYQERTGQISPENNKGQALIPGGFQFCENEMGTAPALYKVQGAKKIFLMPGVPSEMKFFVEKLVMPQLKKILPQRDFYLQTLHLCGMPEALIGEKTQGLSFASGVNLAYLPQGGYVDLRIYGENVAGCKLLQAQLEQIFEQQIVGSGDETLLQKLHEKLLQKKITLAIAESCTGGMLASQLVDFAGSSSYLLGGVVSYANAIKEKILGVDAKTLADFGAVSKEVVEQMAKGAAERFSADLTVAITGIAGPDGGSQEKPVGLVWFAVYYRGQMRSFSKILAGQRNVIRQRAVNHLVSELLLRL